MNKYRIQRYTKNCVIAADGTTSDTTTDSLNGLIKGIIANVPQLVGTTTLTLTIKDADGVQLFSKASIAENAKTGFYEGSADLAVAIPVCGALTLTVTASNAQTGAAATIPVTLLIDRG